MEPVVGQIPGTTTRVRFAGRIRVGNGRNNAVSTTTRSQYIPKGGRKVKKALVLVALAIMVVALPASAARFATPTVDHGTAYVYQCYWSCPSGASCFAGYAGFGAPTVNAVPGILCIDPGQDWKNFVTVAWDTSFQGKWFIKNVVLRKDIPEVGQCWDVFSAGPNYPGFNQQGSPNIRTWWPLMYEAPGTKWTLTVTSGTQQPWQGGYIHQDVWKWEVDATLDSIKCLVELFNELAWGLCEIPLLGNRAFYADLTAQLDAIIAAYNAGDLVGASQLMFDFENDLMDACVTVCPWYAPAQFVGIVNTAENPACCKLIVDSEFVAKKLGIFQPAK